MNKFPSLPLIRIFVLLCCLILTLQACSPDAPVSTPTLPPPPSVTADAPPQIENTPTPIEKSLTASAEPTPSATAQTQPTPLVLSLQTPALEGEDILIVQRRLHELGYTETGQPDGLFTTQTEAAVKRFQYLNNMPVNGVVDGNTADLLFSAEARGYQLPPPFPGVKLQVHPLPDHVTPLCDDFTLQNRLAALGYDPGEDEYSRNIYHAGIRDAVKAFQSANSLPPNGVADLTTWQALFSPLAIPAGGSPAITDPGEIDWHTTIFPTGDNPIALAYDGQRVWVAHASPDQELSNMVLALDPAARLQDPISPITLADCDVHYENNLIAGMVYVGSTHKLWFTFPNSSTSFYGEQKPENLPEVQSLDPLTGLRNSRMPVGSCLDGFCFPSSALGTDGSRLWASSSNQVWSINPTNGAASSPREIGWLTTGRMLFDGTCLWMAGEAGAAVFHPQGGNCSGASQAYAIPAAALTFDGHRIWGADDDFIMSIDLHSGELGPSFIPGSGASALEFDGSFIWAANSRNNTIQAFDPATGSLGDPIKVGAEPVALLFDGSRLWIANAGDNTVQYIDPSAYHIDIIIPTSTSTLAATLTPTPTPTPTPPPFIQELSLTTPNMTGDVVFQVQERLSALGYNVGIADGTFGPMTDAAVRQFQEVNGLFVDGLVGPTTWETLFSSRAKKP